MVGDGRKRKVVVGRAGEAAKRRRGAGSRSIIRQRCQKDCGLLLVRADYIGQRPRSRPIGHGESLMLLRSESFKFRGRRLGGRLTWKPYNRAYIAYSEDDLEKATATTRNPLCPDLVYTRDENQAKTGMDTDP